MALREKEEKNLCGQDFLPIKLSLSNDVYLCVSLSLEPSRMSLPEFLNRMVFIHTEVGGPGQGRTQKISHSTYTDFPILVGSLLLFVGYVPQTGMACPILSIHAFCTLFPPQGSSPTHSLPLIHDFFSTHDSFQTLGYRKGTFFTPAGCAHFQCEEIYPKQFYIFKKTILLDKWVWTFGFKFCSFTHASGFGDTRVGA